MRLRETARMLPDRHRRKHAQGRQQGQEVIHVELHLRRHGQHLAGQPRDDHCTWVRSAGAEEAAEAVRQERRRGRREERPDVDHHERHAPQRVEERPARMVAEGSVGDIGGREAKIGAPERVQGAHPPVEGHAGGGREQDPGREGSAAADDAAQFMLLLEEKGDQGHAARERGGKRGHVLDPDRDAEGQPGRCEGGDEPEPAAALVGRRQQQQDSGGRERREDDLGDRRDAAVQAGGEGDVEQRRGQWDKAPRRDPPRDGVQQPRGGDDAKHAEQARRLHRLPEHRHGCRDQQGRTRRLMVPVGHIRQVAEHHLARRQDEGAFVRRAEHRKGEARGAQHECEEEDEQEIEPVRTQRGPFGRAEAGPGSGAGGTSQGGVRRRTREQPFR